MTDTIAATELVLTVDNEWSLYPLKKAIIANLCKHVARGNYDHAGAVKAFGHLAESGAKFYAREHANAAEWFRIFPPATRRAAAEQWAGAFEIEYACNQWDGINPVAADKRKPLAFDPWNRESVA